VYVDGTLSNKSIVKKFDGTNWVNVGSATGVNFYNSAFDKIAFSKTGVPYIAFSDYTPGPNGRISCMRFNGTTWTFVGSGGFTAGSVNACNIRVDAAGNPCIAYGDAANGNKMTVSRFNGTTWVAVGPATGFSTAGALNSALEIANDGTLYTAYADASRSNRVTVKKFDGTNWVSVGTDGFTAAAVGTNVIYKQIALTLNNAGTNPVVAYVDAGAANKATAMRFNGTAWTLTGAAGYSNNTNNTKNLHLVQYKNTLYTTFTDQTLWNSNALKYVLCNPSTAAVPVATPGTICAGGSAALSVTAGSLNDGTTWAWYTGSCGGTLVGTGNQITVNPVANTTYYVRGEGGCVTAAPCASVTVTVNPLPDAPFISLTTGGLQSSYTNSNQWFLNGTAIAGAGAQLYAPEQSGSYTVRYTNAQGCSSTSAPYVATVSSVVNTDAAELYPNPAKNYVRVRFPYFVPNFSVTVSSMESKKILSAEYRNTNMATLDISRLQPGVYLLRVFSADGTYKTFRLVKGNN
jgi:hypothetical protein